MKEGSARHAPRDTPLGTGGADAHAGPTGEVSAGMAQDFSVWPAQLRQPARADRSTRTDAAR